MSLQTQTPPNSAARLIFLLEAVPPPAPLYLHEVNKGPSKDAVGKEGVRPQWKVINSQELSKAVSGTGRILSVQQCWPPPFLWDPGRALQNFQKEGAPLADLGDQGEPCEDLSQLFCGLGKGVQELPNIFYLLVSHPGKLWAAITLEPSPYMAHVCLSGGLGSGALFAGLERKGCQPSLWTDPALAHLFLCWCVLCMRPPQLLFHLKFIGPG